MTDQKYFHLTLLPDNETTSTTAFQNVTWSVDKVEYSTYLGLMKNLLSISVSSEMTSSSLFHIRHPIYFTLLLPLGNAKQLMLYALY